LSLGWSKQFPEFVFNPPKSTPIDGKGPITADGALNAAREIVGTGVLGITIPHHGPTDSFVISTNLHEVFRPGGYAVVDQYSGKLLAGIRKNEIPHAAQLYLLAYPIHIGSFCGLPTKILAAITSLGLVAMSVTGIWMWWQRRPRGKTGFPQIGKSREVPRTVVLIIIVLAIIFPTVGVTLLGLFLISLVARALARMLGRKPQLFQ
jgi:uncharacterized iron-regulated membrane protein